MKRSPSNTGEFEAKNVTRRMLPQRGMFLLKRKKKKEEYIFFIILIVCRLRLYVGMATWVQVAEEASGTGSLQLELQAL